MPMDDFPECGLIDKRLPAPGLWVEPSVCVRETGVPVAFTIQEAIKFHGLDSIGGVILGFRLLQKAFSILSPDSPPDRRAISLFTSFPGPGARDTFELVTRMVSEGRYQADPAHENPEAPEGVNGRLYFRFSYDGKTVALASPQGVPDENFIKLGRLSKNLAGLPESRQAEILSEWTAAKFALASLLLQLPFEEAIRVLK